MTDVATPVQDEVPAMKALPATPLTALDRCDRCGAQARVRTEHAGLELLWCAHHYREHGEALSCHVTLDDRGKLNKAASVSAH